MLSMSSCFYQEKERLLSKQQENAVTDKQNVRRKPLSPGSSGAPNASRKDREKLPKRGRNASLTAVIEVCTLEHDPLWKVELNLAKRSRNVTFGTRADILTESGHQSL